jgi:diguanylate cyclase (GGDEF)-like protein
MTTTLAGQTIENRRVLIIDDTESIHQDFRKTLLGNQNAGDVSADEAALFGDAGESPTANVAFEIDSAMQGQDGYDCVRRAVREGRPYALAFVDMRMPPGWDGVQTIKNLWTEDPHLQVVICTAHSDYSWEQIVEQLGTNDRLLILKKPFDHAEVCQLATALTAKWQLSQKAKLKVDELEQMVDARTEELRHAAMHDRLTGLPNRSLLTERLKRAIATHERDGQSFALLFLDFDRFKVINDSLGHAMGDLLLQNIADRIRGLLANRPKEKLMASRLGGDEFVVLVEEMDKLEEVTALAGDLVNELRTSYTLKGHEVHTTASMGITTSEMGYAIPEDILRDADNAMYRAKTLGKDRWVLFDRSMHEQACARLAIETDLRRAVDRHEFVVMYQPIVLTESGKISGFEALVRWRHPQRGIVSPAHFIPIAEETGLICEIGRFVMRQACEQMAAWGKKYPAAHSMYMSVNLSKRQVLEAGLIREVAGALEAAGLPAKCLKLEVTESLIMDKPEVIIPLLEQLRKMGVGLAMDDFGTGHSSLTWLKRFPVDTLKIDRGFIMDLDGKLEYAAIIQAIVTLAYNLKMRVTAEGVETRSQLAQIQSLDCDSAQGYYFSPPVHPSEIEEFLRIDKVFGPVGE